MGDLWSIPTLLLSVSQGRESEPSNKGRGGGKLRYAIKSVSVFVKQKGNAVQSISPFPTPSHLGKEIMLTNKGQDSQ